METGLAIESRHSRRVFEQKPVEWEKIVKVLNAARLAPSAINTQPWHFVVVQDSERIKAIVSADSFFNKWMKKAPVLIVACVKEGKFAQIDLGLSIENLLIMATDLGLGTTPAAVSNKDKLGEIINCPKEFTPMITIALGYALEKKSFSEKMLKTILKKKKSLNQIASKEQFGNEIKE